MPKAQSMPACERLHHDALTNQLDATVWAEHFLQRFPETCAIHDLVGWFAHAIMAGYDKGVQRSQDQLDRQARTIGMKDEALRSVYERLYEVEYQLQRWKAHYALR